MYTYKIHSHLIQIFRCTREPNQKKQWKQFNSSLASGLKETRQISESRDFLHRFLWRLQLTTTKSKLYLGKLEARRLATKTPTQSKLVPVAIPFTINGLPLSEKQASLPGSVAHTKSSNTDQLNEIER